jgi:hypothetical protein
MFLHTFFKNVQISNFMEIRPVGAELFHADGRTDRHDEADIRFSQFFEITYKGKVLRSQSREYLSDLGCYAV